MIRITLNYHLQMLLINFSLHWSVFNVQNSTKYRHVQTLSSNFVVYKVDITVNHFFTVL